MSLALLEVSASGEPIYGHFFSHQLVIRATVLGQKIMEYDYLTMDNNPKSVVFWKNLILSSKLDVDYFKNEKRKLTCLFSNCSYLKNDE